MSRSVTGRRPFRCPTTCFASRTVAFGSTPASRAGCWPAPLGVASVAWMRVGVQARAKQDGQDQPGYESPDMGKERDSTADDAQIQKGVEGLQGDPIADKDVGGQRYEEDGHDERQHACPREVDDVGG